MTRAQTAADKDAAVAFYDSGTTSGMQRILTWNGSGAQNNINYDIVLPTSTGVQVSGGWPTATIAYLAIRA